MLVDKGVLTTFDRQWKVYRPEPCERAYLMDVMSVGHLLGLHYSYYISKVIELHLYFIPGWLLRT